MYASEPRNQLLNTVTITFLSTVSIAMLQFAEEEVKSNSYMSNVLIAKQVSRKQSEVTELRKLLAKPTVTRDDVDAVVKRVR